MKITAEGKETNSVRKIMTYRHHHLLGGVVVWWWAHLFQKDLVFVFRLLYPLLYTFSNYFIVGGLVLRSLLGVRSIIFMLLMNLWWCGAWVFFQVSTAHYSSLYSRLSVLAQNFPPQVSSLCPFGNLLVQQKVVMWRQWCCRNLFQNFFFYFHQLV